jgi:hypothetical protein
MTGRSQNITAITREPRDFPWALHFETLQLVERPNGGLNAGPVVFVLTFKIIKLIDSSNLRQTVHPPLSFQDSKRVEQPHMDMENKPREGSDEGLDETNMPQVSASVSENRLCEPNIGRDRTIISTSGVDSPHGDAGQGEFCVGGEGGRA